MTYSSSLAMEVVTHGIPTLNDVQYIDLQKHVEYSWIYMILNKSTSSSLECSKIHRKRIGLANRTYFASEISPGMKIEISGL